MKLIRHYRGLLLAACVAVGLTTAGLALGVDGETPSYTNSAQYKDGHFQNPKPRPTRSFWQQIHLFWTVFFNKPPGTVPDHAIQINVLSRESLLAAPDNSVYRLGHSSLLLKMQDKYWLTDPVFSQRASPFQWIGPERFHAPPISIDDLPPIQAVILSHDHYDHLDHDAILKLAAKTGYFLAPLGVGKLLVSWGVPQEKVRELDWWQATEVDGIRFVSTPAQHFSGRGLTNRDETLWSSWAILAPSFRLYFSGDTGYSDSFKTIGERYGPFDMAFMETGAYDPRWTFVHMAPEETLQAFRDLRAKWLFPIHNGTFDLAMHLWTDPFERITKLATDNGAPLTTPRMGERVDFLAPHAGSAWWRY